LINPSAASQTLSPLQQAQQTLDSLSPEERVGQLFLATFNGINVETESPIQDLIANHHIGGVIFLARNDNFSADEDALAKIFSLNRQLQLNRWSASQQQRVNTLGESFTPTFIPLFIAISQEGDGYPYDQILTGVTPLPNQMALGATFNPEVVDKVGSVLGQELGDLGFNLLLGPSLDVLEAPQRVGGSGLGTRAFGGDPFWVGKLGQAFIRGVHNGSGGKVAVVAKHFPGNGGADRLPEVEVATVRKSLEQLQNFDLAPFFDVTGNAPSQTETADALLTSHIRYQGFQGNIRATTRPVSFDQQAFNLLMNLTALTSWRQNGGVMVSDDLGSQAIRRFFELTNPNQPFDPSRVALTAFLAGNDLLYLGDMSAGEEVDSYTSIVNILGFFAQKYRDDPAFAERVNASVLRILALKYRLYRDFSLNQTLPSQDGLVRIGKSSQVSLDVALQSATLISPSLAELDETLPDPPNRNERIVFFSDVRTARQCSLCPDQVILPVDALQQAVIRLYGPDAGRQVTPWFLISYSYQDLLKLLDGDEDTFQLQRDISRANWIVFASLDVNSDNPASQTLHRFLAERPTLIHQKKLVVFSFNAPTYLDATNIAKLTAYYGLYSKTPNFFDVAARLLFKELRPTGSLPISVPDVGYDLITVTMPDPEQILSVVLDLPPSTAAVETQTLQTPLPTEYRINSVIPVRTEVILDHNGHPVPDGTPVQFITLYNGEVSALPQSVTTIGGIARANVQVTDFGMMEIRVESEPAKQSTALRFDIPLEDGGLTPTPTTQPTETPTPSPSPTPEPTLNPEAAPPPLARPHLQDWLIALMVTITASLGTYRFAAFIGQIRWGVRGGFLSLIGGLSAYTYLASGLPGSQDLIGSSGAFGILLVTVLGCVTGILVAWAWRYLQVGSKFEN
jgi:beta-N-acetylhexosaminidase